MFYLRILCAICFTASTVLPAFACLQADEINYDESKVPQYTLPDPLQLEGGPKVTDAETWWKQRRPQILELFETQV